MFKGREGIVLNWRGPLLAAGIFGSVFAILLLMAHQNQSKSSDMGSSLREDPYGTRLLFDSYQRAGYKVNRSQDEDSLLDQNASRTTAFFVGGRPLDVRMEKGKFRMGEKFLRRIEEFLARGGRVVLIAPVGQLKSESQGWEVENKWHESPQERLPAWISPSSEAMPPGSEEMYLSADAPWLETDGAWTTLYGGRASSDENKDSPARVYMAMRRVGNGELIVASQESFLLNEAIKTHPNPVLLDFLAGGRPVILVDETLHGLHQDQGVLWLVQRYRLQGALLLFWLTLLILLWSMSGDLVRRPARDQNALIVRPSEGAGVAARRLLQRSVATESLVAECWEHFRRRSPRDAEAMSADPACRERVKAALSMSPVAGYRELSQLIAERRASVKGQVREHSTTSLSTSSEETRIL